MLGKLDLHLEGSVKGQERDPEAYCNRGRGRHRDILQFKKIRGNKFMVVYQDRIALVTGESGSEPDQNHEAQVLVQYERDADADMDYYVDQHLQRRKKNIQMKQVK